MSEQRMSEQPWYRDGLRFECTQCGDCCTGAPGYVWVNKEEIEALAKRYGLAVDVFEQKYVRRVGVRKSLVEFENGDCVFFDGQARRCTVYEDRPRQCRTWPFWDSNVRTEKAWKETCQICPGSGQGAIVPVEKIIAQLAVIKI
jgi:Fe-S-cluster containining protein